MSDTRLTVGRHSIDSKEATDLITTYVTHSDGVYAWPFYDHLETGSGIDEVSDADLLAPVLLNVRMGLDKFAALVGRREVIESHLAAVPDDIDLVDASDAQVGLVASLFEVIDDPGIPGSTGTTLSKVLHRKRPRLVPLTMRWCGRHLSARVGLSHGPGNAVGLTT